MSELRQRREPIPGGLALKHRLADRLVYSKVKERLGGRLRAAISGGAPLAKEIAEFFHVLDILVLEGYGQTEETSAATVNRPSHYKFGTVGPAIPGIGLKLAEDGEILISGPTVFAGYLNDEAATRAALPGDGWLHTGDVGTLDEDDFLTVTDRKKDLIVTAGGKNVSPQNLENMLKTVPRVSHALVVGDRRPYLVALITLDDDEVKKLDRRERREHAHRAGRREHERRPRAPRADPPLHDPPARLHTRAERGHADTEAQAPHLRGALRRGAERAVRSLKAARFPDASLSACMRAEQVWTHGPLA